MPDSPVSTSDKTTDSRTQPLQTLETPVNTPVPYHKHTGVDSPLIDYTNVKPDVQIFTTNGIWTKPVNASVVKIVCIGDGGGGGSGRRMAAGNATSSGAAGGGGGAVTFAVFNASDLGVTETVTVGGGGAG